MKTMLLLVLCSALAWASDPIQIGTRTYVRQDGDLFLLDDAGELHPVDDSKLLIRAPSGSRMTTEEIEALGVGSTCACLAGIFISDLPTREDPIALAQTLSEQGYEVLFDPIFAWQEEPNDFYYAPTGSSSDDWQGQWNLNQIGMDSVWLRYQGGSPDHPIVNVDQGVDLDHEDLGNFWQNPGEIPGNDIDDDQNGYVDDTVGWDFFDDDNDPNPADLPDVGYHGTAVAGILAAKTDNFLGVASVAGQWQGIDQWGATQMVARTQAQFSYFCLALKYADHNGAALANLSFAGREDPVFRDLFDYLGAASELIMVASAGNDETTRVGVPARYEETIAVGALAKEGAFDFGTAYGPELDLAAPYRVTTTDNMGIGGRDPDSLEYHWDNLNGTPSLDYNPRFGGTSSAAPHVAAAANMLLRINPYLSTEQVRQALNEGADKVRPDANEYNDEGFSELVGHGRLNVSRSMNLAGSIPSIDIVSPGNGDRFTVGETVTISWDILFLEQHSVNLKLYNDLGFVGVIQNNIGGGSSFLWNAIGVEPGEKYRIKVEVVGEEGTNYGFSSGFFTFRPGHDLSISREQISDDRFTPGENAALLSFIVGNNNCNRQRTSVQPTTARLYLSEREDSFDGGTPLGEPIAVPGLESGRVYQASAEISIPEGTAFGDWYIHVLADADQAQGECDEDNNLAVVPIQVVPFCQLADLDESGSVSIVDITAVLNETIAPAVMANGKYNLKKAPPGFPEMVDTLDLNAVMTCWGQRMVRSTGGSLQGARLVSLGRGMYRLKVAMTGEVNTVQAFFRMPATGTASSARVYQPLYGGSVVNQAFSGRELLVGNAFDDFSLSYTRVSSEVTLCDLYLSGVTDPQALQPVSPEAFETGVAIQVLFGDGTAETYYLGLPQSYLRFPDSRLRDALVDAGVDRNGDGRISQYEAETTRQLDIRNHGIDNLEGIGAFVNLVSLDCSGNNIPSLEPLLGTNLGLDEPGTLIAERNFLGDDEPPTGRTSPDVGHICDVKFRGTWETFSVKDQKDFIGNLLCL